MLLGSMVLFSCASAASAQGTPPAASPKPAAPVKIQIVISRFDGEKKVANLPYMLFGTDDDNPITLNLGLQFPVPGGTNGAAFTYKPIGTNISCRVRATPDGKFKLDLVVDSSSIVPDKTISTPGGVPAFQSFTVHNNLMLSEGQTVQYASVVDPVTGQVTKVDATLTVVK
jgi:hypothetical protein